MINIGFALLDQTGMFAVGQTNNQNLLNDFTPSAVDDAYDYEPSQVSEDQQYDVSGIEQFYRGLKNVGKFVGTVFWIPATMEKLGLDTAVSWAITTIVWVCWIAAAIQIFGKFGGHSLQ